MGCWNKTCGLSNLHIFSGTEVYVFLLEQHNDDSRCYSTALYRPLLLPFYSEYNDYGGGEESHGVALNYIIEGLKEDLVEMEVGENEYHDIEVKKEGFDIDKFFNAVHEHRLFIKNAWGEKSAIEFVMFRKDIVDDILNTWELEKYVGDGKGTTGYGNNYITYKFADVLADVPAFLDRLYEVLTDETKVPEHLKGLPANLISSLRFRGLDNLFKYEENNKAAWFVRCESHRYCKIVDVGQLIADSFIINRAHAEELLVEHLKAQFIDTFMDHTRHIWVPGAHEGSQSSEHSGYRVLTSVINAALDREKAEWDAENGEDEDDFE